MVHRPANCVTKNASMRVLHSFAQAVSSLARQVLRQVDA